MSNKYFKPLFLTFAIIFGLLILPRGIAFTLAASGGMQIHQMLSGRSEKSPEKLPCALDPIVEKSQDKVMSAIKILDLALKLNPNRSWTYLSIARGYCLIGDYEKAIVSYKQLINKHSSNPLIHTELAIAYESFCFTHAIENELEIKEIITNRPTLDQCRRQDLVNEVVTELEYAGFSSQDLLGEGVHYINQSQYLNASLWFSRAFHMRGENLDEFPPTQNPNYFRLESFATSTAWHPCSWCENTPGSFNVSGGILNIQYTNDLTNRDRIAYRTEIDIPIDHYETFLIRLKGSQNSLVTIELVVDNERYRPISYQLLPIKWNTWSIPIDGDILEEVILQLGENSPSDVPGGRQLSVDWIALQ